MSEVRLIDAEAFCSFLREVSTRQHYETLLTKKDSYPTVADVIEEICCELDGTGLNGYDNAPTIKPNIEKIYEDINRMYKNIQLLEECNKPKKGEKVENTSANFDDNVTSFFCSRCFMDVDGNSNYCWFCGADLRRK